MFVAMVGLVVVVVVVGFWEGFGFVVGLDVFGGVGVMRVGVGVGVIVVVVVLGSFGFVVFEVDVLGWEGVEDFWHSSHEK